MPATEPVTGVADPAADMPGQAALDEEEQRQFMSWLSRQDPTRRKYYLALAKGYGLDDSLAAEIES